MSKMMTLIGLAGLVVVGLVVFRFTQTSSSGSAFKEEMEEWSALELQKWHEFTSPSHHFKVLMPTLPQHAKEKINDPTTKEARAYDMYVSLKDNGSVFMISLISLLDNPAKTLDPSMLSNVVDNMVSGSPNSKVKKMEMGKYKEYPSIDFSFENPDANVDGKAFIVGNTLILLTGVAKPSDYNQKEFDFFVNSFQLTPRETNEKEDILEASEKGVEPKTAP